MFKFSFYLTLQGAFIPTMPDDMLAVAQAVIQQDYGQLTWYGEYSSFIYKPEF